MFFCRVLIIDDNAGIRMLLREVLEANGCIVAEATNGVMGCQKAVDFNPDIVLIDYKMPQLSGPSTLIKMNKIGITVPAIMITAFSDGVELEKYQYPNLYACITKPFNVTKLLAIIKECLKDEKRLTGA